MPSRLTSIFKNLCPRCHKGKVFVHRPSFLPKKFDQMHDTCTHCELKYEKEVGFFYGAMYVSYGLTAGWVIATFVINALFFDIDVLMFILLVTLPIVIMAPITFRTARLIWLNLFFHYEQEYAQGAKKA